MKKRLTGVFALILVTAPLALCTEFTRAPYLQAVTTTGITIMWETDQVGDAHVDYGPTDALGRTTALDARDRLVKVRLKGLEPDTTYYYRVTRGDAVSLTSTFRTLPVTGPFSFVVYGDSRSHPADHAKVLSHIAAVDPAFVVHSGDIVGDGTKEPLWGPEFFEPAGPFIARVAMFFAVGNHEDESPIYYKYLGAHSPTPWYSFDCVNAHFVILDSCLDCSPRSRQHKWLVDDLRNTDKRWRFVTFHHPLYSSGVHGSSIDLREILEPVFRRYAVDVVFAGHDHHYERTHPVTSAFIKDVRPITYVVSGGGGAPLRSVAGDFFTASAASVLNYCRLDIDGNTLFLRAFDGDAGQIDSLRIVKLGDTYANTYPAGAVPFELACAEGAIRTALADKTIELPGDGSSATVSFHLPAPTWSSLELELTWTRRENAPLVSPATANVVIPAGRTVTAAFDVSGDASRTARPSLSVRGKTSLGEFHFAVSLLRVKLADSPAPPP